jgi:hypothetical protein
VFIADICTQWVSAIDVALPARKKVPCRVIRVIRVTKVTKVIRSIRVVVIVIVVFIVLLFYY